MPEVHFVLEYLCSLLVFRRIHKSHKYISNTQMNLRETNGSATLMASQYNQEKSRTHHLPRFPPIVRQTEKNYFLTVIYFATETVY